MSWNGSGGSPTKKVAPKPKTGVHIKRGAMAGLIVIFGCAVSAFFIFGRSSVKDISASERKNNVARISDAVPVATTHPHEENKTIVATNQGRMVMGSLVVSSRPETNANGGVTEYMTLSDGRKISKYTPPKPVFDNAADQMIAMLLTAKPGQALPPMPDISSVDKDFVQAILKPIKINDDDPEEVKELKQKVIEARSTLVDEIKKGASVREVLSQYQADLEKMAETHQIASEQLQEIKNTEGEEAAEEFRKRVNKKFTDEGIPELKVNKRKKGQNK